MSKTDGINLSNFIIMHAVAESLQNFFIEQTHHPTAL